MADYRDAPTYFGGEVREWIKQVAQIANELRRGKVRSTGDVTLTVSSATTTLTDPNIGANSYIDFMPQTANAAAEIGAGGFYVTGRGGGQATLNHANNANADRTYTYLVMGG